MLYKNYLLLFLVRVMEREDNGGIGLEKGGFNFFYMNECIYLYMYVFVYVIKCVCLCVCFNVWVFVFCIGWANKLLALDFLKLKESYKFKCISWWFSKLLALHLTSQISTDQAITRSSDLTKCISIRFSILWKDWCTNVFSEIIMVAL